MESVDLRVFEIVAETKSLTRAAQVLNTVQSNVTGRIKRLEHELGTELLLRHSRGVALTPAGEMLLPFAVRMRQVLEDARSTVGKQNPERVRGVLRIGTIETFAAVRLPHILLRYSELFPNVEVTLGTGLSSDLRQQVLDHRLDAAFVAGKAGVGALEETEMCSEELALIGPAAFNGKAALKKSGTVRVLVFRTGCSYRRYLESFLVDLGINQIRAIELGTLEGILGCVSAGLGITLLPKAVVEQSPYKNNLSVHGIASPHSIVPTFFIRRANSYTNLALKHFMETAAAQLKNGTRRAAKNGIARSGLNLMITEAPA